MSKNSLKYKQQEPAFDSPESCWHYRLDGSKFVGTTSAASVEFTREEIIGVLELLQQKAVEHNGLDYLQTFEDEEGRRLWVTENSEAIMAMLPSDW